MMSGVLFIRLLVFGVLIAFVSMAKAQPETSDCTGPIIRMNLIVLDDTGTIAQKVDKNSFRVTDGEQPLKVCALEVDLRPLVYAVAVDSSNSFRPWFETNLRLVQALIESNRAEDEMGVVSFSSSDHIQLLDRFTSNKAELIQSLKLLNLQKGQTALIDAVYLTLEHVTKHRPKDDVRRAIVLLSDGDDRDSFYKLDQLIRLIKQTEVQIFVIGMLGKLDKDAGLLRPSVYQRALKLLETIAQESGGRLFTPKKLEDLPDAAVLVNRSLGDQFIISFERGTESSKSQSHRFKISLVRPDSDKGTKVDTRPLKVLPETVVEKKN